MNVKQDTLYIGIDAGGTKTELCARTSSNNRVIVIDGPGANLRRDGLSETVNTLVRLIHELTYSFPKYLPTNICIGIAGAGNKEGQKTLKQELEEQLDMTPIQIEVRADASIAYYAAHRDQSGILVITGTGSIIWARTKTGQMVRAGGWGALLGDEGGGFQIGLAALRALSQEIDGGPPTLLSQILCDNYGLCTPSDILDFTYQHKDNIQTLAPFVLEAAAKKDDIASKIINEQVAGLAQSLQFLTLSHPHISPKLVYMGGLTRNKLYSESLKRGLLDVNPDLSITSLSCTPAEGALKLATKMDV